MQKNGMRVIGVVMGEEDSNTRNNEMSSLLDYAFAQYSLKNILKKDSIVKEVNLDKSKKDKVSLVADDDINILYKKMDKEPIYDTKIKLNKIPASIKKGTILGSISMYDKNNKLIKKVNLISNEDINKLNLWQLFLKYIREFILAI